MHKTLSPPLVMAGLRHADITLCPFLYHGVWRKCSDCNYYVSRRSHFKDEHCCRSAVNVCNMKNVNKPNNYSKKAKFKPGTKKRENKCIVTFDDNDRQEFLTGFHKRKVERRKAALSEIRKKIKEEQTKLREERHKEYMKLLKERTEALEEDELEDMITGTTESVQYDHPNHTVTVTTISDLDLTGSHLLGPADNPVNGDSKDENEQKGDEEEEKTIPVPKKAGKHMTNKKIRSLRASLSTFTSKRKRKGKQEGRGQRGRPTDKNAGVSEFKSRTKRTTKQQRRKRVGNKVHHQD